MILVFWLFLKKRSHFLWEMPRETQMKSVYLGFASKSWREQRGDGREDEGPSPPAGAAMGTVCGVIPSTPVYPATVRNKAVKTPS